MYEVSNTRITHQELNGQPSASSAELPVASGRTWGGCSVEVPKVQCQLLALTVTGNPSSTNQQQI